MTAVRLENWSFCKGEGDGYTAPEQVAPRLHGEAYGHPHYADGKVIYTSSITGYDETTGEFICVSRHYTLGEVDEEYNESFPGARERIIESAKKLNKGS